MIELSKCPDCAPEDRVTIAGKDFCMRCGTPSEDNAMIAATGAQSAQPSDASSQVSKFSEAPAQRAVNQVTTEQPVVAVPSTPQTNADNSAVPTVPEVPMQTVSANELNPAVANGPTNIPANTPPQVQDTTATAPDNATMVDNNASAIAQADQKIDELTIAPLPNTPPAPTLNESTPVENSASTLPTTSINQPVAIPLQQFTAVPTAPPQPSNQPPAIDAISATPAPVSKIMPGVDTSMNLDKSEPGVFSDEELHALSNTVVDSPAPNNSIPAQVATQPSLELNTAVSNTMAKQSASQAPVPSAMASQAQTKPQAPSDMTLPPKTSITKKALKPVGVLASVALLFAVGFYMWRINYPSLAFKIASSKAGINATMPGNMPEGYNLSGNIQANPGTVAYSLTNQNSKKLAISQSKTDWDSQALAENYVSPKAENYLAIQAQGLTIYMMGSNQASWVNKGTWYRIESPDQPLTQEQVVKLATSL